jgi:hypothetical protein
MHRRSLGANFRIRRIPRASPGMMCVCRRRRLADKDLDQPAIGLQQAQSNWCWI